MTLLGSASAAGALGLTRIHGDDAVRSDLQRSGGLRRRLAAAGGRRAARRAVPRRAMRIDPLVALRDS
jgi:hypothetical protein